MAAEFGAHTRSAYHRLLVYTGRQYPGEAVVSVDGQSSKAMADQLMAADKARLKSQLGTVSKADMQAVEDAIRVHLGLTK